LLGCRLKAAEVGARAGGEAGGGKALQHQELEAEFLAVSAFAALVTVFVDSVDVGLEPADFRVGIEPALTSGDEGLVNEFDGTDDIAPFLLRQEWMARPFEQADVGVMADNDVQVAVGADFLEETDMAGVEPVVAAGDDDLIAAGNRRLDGRLGKASELFAGERLIVNLAFLAEVLPLPVRSRRVVRPNVGAELLGELVAAHPGFRFEDPGHKADGVEDIRSLSERELGRLPGELLDQRIGPEQNGQVPEFGGLFEETQLAGTEIVKSAADDDAQ